MPLSDRGSRPAHSGPTVPDSPPVGRFLLPAHFNHERTQVALSFPNTGVVQPVIMEQIGNFIQLPQGLPLSFEDVLPNLGKPFFFLTARQTKHDDGLDFYVPEGMGGIYASRFKEENYLWRLVPEGRHMTLLDLIMAQALKTKEDISWLFDPGWTKSGVLKRLGLAKQVGDEQAPDVWNSIGEQVFTYLRHTSGQGMRRQDDFNLYYAVSRNQLPEGEMGEILMLPLTTVEHYIKEHA